MGLAFLRPYNFLCTRLALLLWSNIKRFTIIYSTGAEKVFRVCEGIYCVKEFTDYMDPPTDKTVDTKRSRNMP